MLQVTVELLPGDREHGKRILARPDNYQPSATLAGSIEKSPGCRALTRSALPLNIHDGADRIEIGRVS
ncbi:hypothetical protein [Paraburkholderia sp. GAS42]|jgi:hypothetical protein|uniref:hypothetical protein n=1 Tax=Paraburkholderia sp. GAS42 TaxID=3035135 RepID=UPI003D1BA456